MTDAQEIPEFEYRIYGSTYHVVAKVDESGHAQIKAVETVGEKQQKPAITSANLDAAAKEELTGLLSRITLASWYESRVVAETRAVLVTDTRGAAWDAFELGEDGPPCELRKWAEANLNLSSHASEQAKERAIGAEDDEKDDIAAHAYKEAVDRLENWWLPEGPVVDATELRYAEANAALKNGDYDHAMALFSQVLEMRSADYRDKYGL